MPHARSGGFRAHESAPAYYEWTTPGQPFKIRINLDVIDRLSADVMKGFWAVPKRGMEIGGILLGRDGGEYDPVVIEDYEPVVSEHRRGPSYVLSEPDRRRLEKTLRRKSGDSRIVGFFRSHTRLGLYLDEDDFALIRSYFADPRHVVLLVRPHASSAATAGFFYWEEGHIHRQATYLQFPFDRQAILKQTGVPEIARPPAASVGGGAGAAVAFERAPETAPNFTPPAPAQIWRQLDLSRLRLPRIRMPRVRVRIPAPRLRWRSVALGMLVLATFGLLEYQILTVAKGRTEPVVTAPDLAIEQQGEYLKVNWNRSARAVADAERAVLFITDGGVRRELKLDPGQLRYGSIAYSPVGNDINFRLELLWKNKSLSESLRVITSAAAKPPAAGPSAAKAPPVQEIADAERTPPEAEKKKPSRRRPRRWYDDGL